jgi:hypothetical protein
VVKGRKRKEGRKEGREEGREGERDGGREEERKEGTQGYYTNDKMATESQWGNGQDKRKKVQGS